MKFSLKLWFRITEKDFKFLPTKGRGAGGQARNKKETACICQHKASGAEGYAEDSRNFLDNKRLSFQRCAEGKVFQAWLRMKIDAGNGLLEIEEPDDYGTMQPKRKVRLDEI